MISNRVEFYCISLLAHTRHNNNTHAQHTYTHTYTQKHTHPQTYTHSAATCTTKPQPMYFNSRTHEYPDDIEDGAWEDTLAHIAPRAIFPILRRHARTTTKSPDRMCNTSASHVASGVSPKGRCTPPDTTSESRMKLLSAAVQNARSHCPLEWSQKLSSQMPFLSYDHDDTLDVFGTTPESKRRSGSFSSGMPRAYQMDHE